jgi:hypothetical protein
MVAVVRYQADGERGPIGCATAPLARMPRPLARTGRTGHLNTRALRRRIACQHPQPARPTAGLHAHVATGTMQSILARSLVMNPGRPGRGRSGVAGSWCLPYAGAVRRRADASQRSSRRRPIVSGSYTALGGGASRIPLGARTAGRWNSFFPAGLFADQEAARALATMCWTVSRRESPPGADKLAAFGRQEQALYAPVG